jgi:protein ImuA
VKFLKMMDTKADIIAQLKKDILPFQGFKTSLKNNVVDATLGPIKNAFPNNSFPLAAIHEFISVNKEEGAATGGFVAALIASLMKGGGVTIWISAARNIFPPALKSFGIAPEKIIFINLKKEKEIGWAMEEALKCKGLSAVIGEIPELSFTTSRRLQLAVEQSNVTGFILRSNPRNLNTTTCVTRWKIRPIASLLEESMPGLGFPRWNVELVKVRNGYPGRWEIELFAGRMKAITVRKAVQLQQPRKAV